MISSSGAKSVSGGLSTSLVGAGKVVVAKKGAGVNGEHALVPGDPPVVIEIGALTGAKLSFTAKPERGTDLQLTSQYLIAPDGNYIPLEAKDVKEKGGKLMFPYLVDPNTGTSMYESNDIVKYLAGTYGVTPR